MYICSFFSSRFVPYALLPTLYCVYIITTFPLIRPTHNLILFSCLTAPLSFNGAQDSNIDIQDCLRHPRHALVRNNVHSSLHKILDGGNRIVQTSSAEKKRAEVHLHTKNFLAASKVSRARAFSLTRARLLSLAPHTAPRTCVRSTLNMCDTIYLHVWRRSECCNSHRRRMRWMCPVQGHIYMCDMTRLFICVT